MYNSILIGGSVKLWNIFSSSYDHSFLKKIVDKIKNFSSYLFQYSIIRSIFVSKDSLIYKSVFYRGFSKIVLFVDKILHRIHKFFMSKTNNSLIYKNINILFKDNKQIMKTISVFVVSLFMGVILNNVFIFHNSLYRGYIVSIVFIFLGILGVMISNIYKEMLDSSFMWKFISSIFTIDEGGENWW